jgi:hypothetical protein
MHASSYTSIIIINDKRVKLVKVLPNLKPNFNILISITDIHRDTGHQKYVQPLDKYDTEHT